MLRRRCRNRQEHSKKRRRPFRSQLEHSRLLRRRYRSRLEHSSWQQLRSHRKKTCGTYADAA